MTDWAIRVPHKSLDEGLLDVAAQCRHLTDPDDRSVQREIALQALLDGVAATAGGLIDHVASLAPEQRRKMLDRARLQLGMPTIDEIEAGAAVVIDTTGLSDFPILDRELPPHLRGLGIGKPTP